MASPAVSTPSSAGSPAPLAPAPQTLAMQPNTLSTPSIITQKEWVIPPRPKPGRKPATDTPPTKRKAQNRAAQRAFRERRAARVGELEEQLEEEKGVYEKREQELVGRVARLEEEVRRAGVEVERWRVRCYTVEGMLEWERGERQRVVEELGVLRYGSRSAGTEAVPLPPRRNHIQNHQQQTSTPKPVEQYTSQAVVGEEDMSTGCGNCTATSACACMEQAIASVTAGGCGKCTPDSRCECSEAILTNLTTTEESATSETDLKRPHSPPNGPEENKRQRQATTPLEIDFTAQFARPSPRRGESSSSFQEPVVTQTIVRTAPIEPCGFCKDGTYCACADMASGGSLPQHSSLLHHDNRLPPLLHEVTPPPSDSDVTSSEGNVSNGKLPVWQPKSMHRAVDIPPPPPSSVVTRPGEIEVENTNPCINGPGTCKQCLSDPRSGMFCRSLAKLKEKGGASSSSTSSGDGCCGGNPNGGGCCRDKVNKDQPSQPTLSNPNTYITSAPQPTLSCAQAYQTLSTHSAFDQATQSKEELNTWLGHLNAVSERVVEGRGPLEVEAASVMEVLKLFDRRFGRG